MGRQRLEPFFGASCGWGPLSWLPGGQQPASRGGHGNCTPVDRPAAGAKGEAVSAAGAALYTNQAKYEHAPTLFSKSALSGDCHLRGGCAGSYRLYGCTMVCSAGGRCRPGQPCTLISETLVQISGTEYVVFAGQMIAILFHQHRQWRCLPRRANFQAAA